MARLVKPDAPPGLHLGADTMEGESVPLNNKHPTVRRVGIIFFKGELEMRGSGRS